MVLTRIAPFSLAKIMGIMYGFLGLIGGGFVALFSLAATSIPQGSGNPGGFGLPGGVESMIMGVGGLIIFPIMYGIMGLIGGLIMALIFNFVVGLAGGLEITLRQDDEPLGGHYQQPQD